MSDFLPLLAIDTAAQQCAVAVLTDFAAYERIEPQPRGQSELVIPQIEQMLHEVGIGFADLRALAVTTGPGGFTGLRVGLAAVHGLALGLGIPAIGIDSFFAFAASLPDDLPLPVGKSLINRAVIIESRRAELYWQVLTPDGKALTDPACDKAEDIAAWLSDKPIILCGDGSRHLALLLPDHQSVDQSPGPSPLAIARVARIRLASAIPGNLPVALYVRPPDAKPSTHG